MQKFDEWYGPYPYKQITLIDPEPDSQMGGMEYPTLITADTSWWEPSWDYATARSHALSTSLATSTGMAWSRPTSSSKRGSMKASTATVKPK